MKTTAPTFRVYHRDAADDAFQEYQKATVRADLAFAHRADPDKYREALAEADAAYQEYRKALQKRHAA